MSESARLEHASATPSVGDAAVDTVTLALRLCHLRLWLFCTLSGSTVDPLGPCPREGKGEGTSQGHMACQLSCPPRPPAPWTGSRRGACPRGARARGTMAARGPEAGRSGSGGREAMSQKLRRGSVEEGVASRAQRRRPADWTSPRGFNSVFLVTCQAWAEEWRRVRCDMSRTPLLQEWQGGVPSRGGVGGAAHRLSQPPRARCLLGCH